MATCDFCGFSVGDTDITCSHCNKPVEAGMDLSEIGRGLVLFALMVAGLLLFVVVAIILTLLYANLFWGGILVVVGTVLFYQMHYDRRIGEESKSWPTTQGEILYTYIVSSTGSRQSTTHYSGHIIYRYQVEGHTYVSNRIGPRNPPTQFTGRRQAEIQQLLEEYPIGSKIPVYYNPKTPEVKSFPQNFWNHYPSINEHRIPDFAKIWDDRDLKMGNSAILPGQHAGTFSRVLQILGAILAGAGLYLLLSSNVAGQYL